MEELKPSAHNLDLNNASCEKVDTISDNERDENELSKLEKSGSDDNDSEVSEESSSVKENDNLLTCPMCEKVSSKYSFEKCFNCSYMECQACARLGDSQAKLGLSSYICRSCIAIGKKFRIKSLERTVSKYESMINEEKELLGRKRKNTDASKEKMETNEAQVAVLVPKKRGRKRKLVEVKNENELEEMKEKEDKNLLPKVTCHHCSIKGILKSLCCGNPKCYNNYCYKCLTEIYQNTKRLEYSSGRPSKNEYYINLRSPAEKAEWKCYSCRGICKCSKCKKTNKKDPEPVKGKHERKKNKTDQNKSDQNKDDKEFIQIDNHIIYEDNDHENQEDIREVNKVKVVKDDNKQKPQESMEKNPSPIKRDDEKSKLDDLKLSYSLTETKSKENKKDGKQKDTDLINTDYLTSIINNIEMLEKKDEKINIPCIKCTRNHFNQGKILKFIDTAKFLIYLYRYYIKTNANLNDDLLLSLDNEDYNKNLRDLKFFIDYFQKNKDDEKCFIKGEKLICLDCLNKYLKMKNGFVNLIKMFGIKIEEIISALSKTTGEKAEKNVKNKSPGKINNEKNLTPKDSKIKETENKNLDFSVKAPIKKQDNEYELIRNLTASKKDSKDIKGINDTKISSKNMTQDSLAKFNYNMLQKLMPQKLASSEYINESKLDNSIDKKDAVMDINPSFKKNHPNLYKRLEYLSKKVNTNQLNDLEREEIKQMIQNQFFSLDNEYQENLDGINEKTSFSKKSDNRIFPILTKNDSFIDEMDKTLSFNTNVEPKTKSITLGFNDNCSNEITKNKKDQNNHSSAISKEIKEFQEIKIPLSKQEEYFKGSADNKSITNSEVNCKPIEDDPTIKINSFLKHSEEANAPANYSLFNKVTKVSNLTAMKNELNLSNASHENNYTISSYHKKSRIFHSKKVKHRKTNFNKLNTGINEKEVIRNKPGPRPSKYSSFNTSNNFNLIRKPVILKKIRRLKPKNLPRLAGMSENKTFIPITTSNFTPSMANKISPKDIYDHLKYINPNDEYIIDKIIQENNDEIQEKNKNNCINPSFVNQEKSHLISSFYFSVLQKLYIDMMYKNVENMVCKLSMIQANQKLDNILNDINILLTNNRQTCDSKNIDYNNTVNFSQYSKGLVNDCKYSEQTAKVKELIDLNNEFSGCYSNFTNVFENLKKDREIFHSNLSISGKIDDAKIKELLKKNPTDSTFSDMTLNKETTQSKRVFVPINSFDPNFVCDDNNPEDSHCIKSSIFKNRK